MSLRIYPTHLWVCTRATELGIDEVSFFPAYMHVLEKRVLKFAEGGRQRLVTFHEAQMSHPYDLEAIHRVSLFVDAVLRAERILYAEEPTAAPETPPSTAWARIQRDD